MNRILSLILLICGLMPACQTQEYNEEAWSSAAKYLKQAMKIEAEPCTDFYEHVCGKYGSNEETEFETTMAGKASAVATILGDAIKSININDTSTPRYKMAIRNFYDKCTDAVIDEKWPKTLYDALRKRIGGLPLFEREGRSGNRTSPPFDPWYLMGKVQRELGDTGLIEAEVESVPDGCRRIPELKIKMISPGEAEEKAALNLTSVRTQLLTLARIMGLNQTKLASKVQPLLKEVSALFHEWKNLSVSFKKETEESERVTLRNLSRILPKFNWRSYFRGLFPDNVTQYLEADTISTQIHLADVEYMAAVGDLFQRYSEEAIRSFMLLKVFYSTRNEYLGEVDDMQLLTSIKSAHDRCLEYSVSVYLGISDIQLARRFLKRQNVEDCIENP